MLKPNAMVLLVGLMASAQADTQPDPLGATAAMAAVCSGCHGESGLTVPSLDGIDAQTLEAQMRQLRDSDGHTAMHRLIKAYDDEAIRGIAQALASRRIAP